MRATSLATILDTVTGLLRRDAQLAGIELVVDQPEGPLCVTAQEIQIEQVLLNLGRNALEAMVGRNGVRQLTLSACPDGPGRIELTVSDTGPGLPPDIAERVFEPFVTSKPQGLGLGLSISAGIVETHGSELRVETDPSVGTSFRFTLPLESQNAPASC
jgi:signal transduction histidine kinase